MAPPVFLRADVWSDLACFSGVRQAFVGDILSLATTRTIDNRDELTLTVSRTNRVAPFLVKLAVIRLVFTDTAYDEEWRITGITQDQVRGTVTVTADWPLIDLATRALLCSTPALVTDDQAPFAFEAIGLTPAQHWDNYVSRGFPAAWSGKVARGTFDVATPQDLVYDWDKPRKIIGDLAQLTNTEISYRRNGNTSYLLDLLTAIGAAAPVLDVRLGKNLVGVTVQEDENKRATTVYPRSALVDGVSYGLAQNRWKVAAMSAGAKTIDLVDPAGKTGPIAFDGQFGTTGLAWRVFLANGPPVSGTNRIITTSAVANQRLTVSVDPTTAFAVGDLLCFGDVDGSGNYTPVWSLNDGPQAIVDPPVAVLKRDDVVAGVNLVPNPLMRVWAGTASDPPDSWIKVDAATTLTKRTTAADYQSGGASCRVQTVADNQGLQTALFPVTPTTGQPYFTAFVRFRIDALTGGAKVKVGLLTRAGTGPFVFALYPNTWLASVSAADSDQIGQWITLAIATPLLDGVGSCTLTAQHVQLQVLQEGAGTADFTVDAAQITQTSYQLPLIEGASGNVLWQAANELIADQRGAQREYAVELLDLASADPTAFPYDQIQLGQTLRVTDPDIGATAVALRLLGLTRDHVTDGALTPAAVRVTVGTVAPSAAGLLAGASLSSRQGLVTGVGGAGSRIGVAPVLPPDLPGRPTTTVYAEDFIFGTDFGAKVLLAEAALPSEGGTIDARGLNGAQSLSAGLTLTKAYVTLKYTAHMSLAMGSYRITVLADGVHVECDTPWGAVLMNGAYPQPALVFSGTGSAFVVGDGTTVLHQFVATDVGIDNRGADVAAVGLEIKATLYFELNRYCYLGSLNASTTQVGLTIDGTHASLFAGWSVIRAPIINRAYRGIRSTGSGSNTGNAILVLGGSLQGANNYASGTAGRGLWIEGGKRWFVDGLDIDNFEAGVYCETSNNFIVFGGENNDTDIVCTSSSSSNEIRDVRGSTTPSDSGSNNRLYKGTELMSNFNAEGISHAFGGSAGASCILQLKAAAGNTRSFIWASANTGIWKATVNGAETGSDAGGLWGLYAYDDSGALIDAVLTVVRKAAGVATWLRRLLAPRYTGNGTAHVAGDYALSAGWGSTATVSAVAARDTGGRVSVTANGAGIGANPTVTLTFKDGTWTIAPALSLSRGDTVAPTTGFWALTTASATAPVFTFVGTPVAGSVYVLDFVTMGK